MANGKRSLQLTFGSIIGLVVVVHLILVLFDLFNVRSLPNGILRYMDLVFPW